MYVMHEPNISNVNYEYKFLPHMKKTITVFPRKERSKFSFRKYRLRQ